MMNQIVLGNGDAFGREEIEMKNEREILRDLRWDGIIDEEKLIQNFINFYNSIFLHEEIHTLGYLNEDRINYLVRKVNGVLNG